MKTIQTGEWDGIPIVREETVFDRMEKFISELPPSTINNSRSIIRNKLESYNKYPSESKAQEVEHLTGICADYHEVLDERILLKDNK